MSFCNYDRPGGGVQIDTYFHPHSLPFFIPLQKLTTFFFFA
jgi:hypothetical protein